MSTASSVLAVVVAYGRAWSAIASAARLMQLMAADAKSGMLRLDGLIVYDNSREPSAMPPLASGALEYHHDPANGGTRGAYAFALERAQRLGFDWILVIDQDTLIPPDYLAAAASALHQTEAENVAAMLPRVRDGGRFISPARLTPSGSIRPVCSLAAASAASLDARLTGVASGCLIRPAALARALPSGQLWLDYVDHWIFRQLAQHHLQVLPFNAVLEHSLSIHHMASMTRARLHSILAAELEFVASLGWQARAALPLRWAGRMLRLASSHPQRALDMLWWIVRRHAA
jgi:hypothetical protein